MKKTVLYSSWGLLYVLCFLLGNAENPQGAQLAALVIMSLLFFVPGVLLLANALRSGDRKTLVVLRWISGLSLGLTVAFVILNIASVRLSDPVGVALHHGLNLVSVPMMCSQFAPLSLFLWACLLYATFLGKKQ